MIKLIWPTTSLIVSAGLTTLGIHLFIPINFWVLLLINLGGWSLVFKYIRSRYGARRLNQTATALMVFDLGVMYALRYFSRNLCTGIINIDFDSQNFFVWDYAAIKGYLPYRDLFYPYGLLAYNSAVNIGVHFLSVLQTPLLLTGLWLTVDRLFRKNSYLKLLYFGLLVGFIVTKTGPISLNRYGLSLIYLMLISWWYYRQQVNSRLLILFGLISALMLTLVTDQGIYSLLATVCLIIYDQAIRLGTVSLRKVILPNILRTLFIYSLGFGLGLIPFLIYLQTSGSLNGFSHFIGQLGAMNLYIKNPFTASLTRPTNILIFISLATSYAALTYKLIYDPKKLRTYSSYAQFTGVLLLSLFFQKNLQRTGIENQISFISLILFGILLADFLNERRKPVSLSHRFSFGILTILVICMTITSWQSVPISSDVLMTLYKHPINYEEINRCKALTIDPQNLIVNDHYRQVMAAVKTLNPDPTIFSFPGDPIFYVLNQQQPAPYFNLYDASARQAQQENLAYIQKLKIKYVIFNTQVKAIQDNVPDIVRGNDEVNYIITHYSPRLKVQQFVVLQRNDLFPKLPQFFSAENIQAYPELYDQLLNLSLGYVPRSEGRVKWPKLNDEAKILVQGKTETEFNQNLKQFQGIITKPLLLMTPSQKSGFNSTVKLTTATGVTTSISFLACNEGKVCLIDLRNIPLFMPANQPTSLHFNDPFAGEIQLIGVNDSKNILW